MEELIAARGVAVGPVVAIADPNNPDMNIATGGAARQWATTESWQAAVADLMAEATLVVVLMDQTENLMWEIEKIVQRGHLAKTMFVFPTRPGDSAGEVDPAMTAMLRRALPPLAGDPLRDRSVAGRLRALLCTDTQAVMVTSRTATYADYDIALQIILSDRHPAAARA